MNKLLQVAITKNNEIEKHVRAIKNDLQNFFNLTIIEPPIFLLQSREEFDIIWKRKTEVWMVGGTKQGSIFILHPQAYIAHSSHTNKDDFWKTLKHEYCHIVFNQITDGSNPLWLNEGLASYLSEQKHVRQNPLDVFKFLNTSDKGIYSVGYFWVELLIRKFGREKFLRLLRSLKKKPNLTENIFSERFFKIYRFDFNKKIYRNCYRIKLSLVENSRRKAINPAILPL